uniref:Interleukin-6 n=1 Tax=Electrophorus electricus TaxID=8005 RepID=A0A4W4FI48_ELEEL
ARRVIWCYFQVCSLCRSLLHCVSSVPPSPTAARRSPVLFRGLNCTEQSAELYFKTRTLSVCVPQLSECSDTIDFTFDQDKCLLRVMGELRYYRATFKDYSDPDHILDLSVIRSIDDLMQTSMEQENSFEGRLKLCKTLKGFQRRPLIEY